MKILSTFDSLLSGKTWTPNEFSDSFTANFAIPIIVDK
jgi:hypothetical protein